jgi:hypothetical protein
MAAPHQFSPELSTTDNNQPIFMNNKLSLLVDRTTTCQENQYQERMIQ